MGRFNLGNTTSALDERGKETDQTVMPDTTEIFETWTGKEMGWISCKKGRGGAAAGRWERVRRRKEKTKAGGMDKLTRGEGKIRRGREAVEPITRGLVGGTDKGTRCSRGVG